MRLIDADALKDYYVDLKKVKDIGYGDVGRMITVNIDHIIKTIDEAPTIEPKRGEWIHHEPFDKEVRNCEPCRECSCCHTWYQYDGIPRLNFCPNCGADMREREGE